nr:immediate early response 3-interacting protein 1-like [Ipomoea batatas]
MRAAYWLNHHNIIWDLTESWSLEQLEVCIGKQAPWLVERCQVGVGWGCSFVDCRTPIFSSKAMGLWTLLEGCLLIANAFAILNEERFLAPRGWSFQEYSGVKRNSFKGQLLGLIYATQYLRVPLMLLNILCIVVKLVSG